MPRRRAWQAWLRPVATLAAGVLLQAAALAGPLAGTAISNQADGRFVGSDGIERAMRSNAVALSVSQAAGLVLDAGSTRSAPAGSTIYLPHRVRNAGNGVDRFRLAVAELPGGFGFISLRLLPDADGDGRPDSNAALVDTGDLAAGAAFGLVVEAVLPAGAAPLASASIRVDATSQRDPAVGSAGATPPVAPSIDIVSVPSGAQLRLVKSATAAVAQPGELLGFRLVASNAGQSAAVAGPAIEIDGRAAAPVLLRDALPPNTSLASIEPPAAGTALYHLVGEAAQRWRSTPPADLSQVDAVALAVDRIDPGVDVAFAFTVRIHANAAQAGSGSLANTGLVQYRIGVDPQPIVQPSNEVRLALPAQPSQLLNYTGPDFSVPAPYARLGGTLFLRADAAACNAGAATIDTRVVVVSSAGGDRENLVATETGPNTGVFTLPALRTESAAVAVNDGTLQAAHGEAVRVELLGCGREIVGTVALQQGYATVFDSRSNAPLAGALVHLVRADALGQCGTGDAEVRAQSASGALQSAPSQVQTGTDGRYQFDVVAPGSYCLRVTPPSGYAAPSAVPVTQLPGGRLIVASGPTAGGSYGGAFTNGPQPGPVQVDVPLDASQVGVLAVQKSANRASVEIGDFLDYAVKVRNNASLALATGVQLQDTLPAGFVYEPGTARLDARTLAEPGGGRGPVLVFDIGTLAAGTEATLRYRVRVGPGALEGDGTNRVRASAGGLQSNQASATVLVQGGVFDRRGFIVGRVYLDCNRNRVQDEGELGIPGARVFLEDGTSAIADGEGKYSFYGVSPRTHVLKLDMASMPVGSELINLTNRNAGDAGSMFVDLKNGELFKANFAEGSCQPEVLEEVQARRRRASAPTAEGERVIGARMEADTTVRPIGDVRAQPASGKVAAVVAPGFTPLAQPAAAPLQLPPTPTAVAAVERRPLEELLPELPAALGFVDLKDGDTLPTAQTAVRLRGVAGGELRLLVNGEPVPANRVGRKSMLAERQVQAWEYIGVALRPGRNQLLAQQFDGFGNPRGEVAIEVIAPGRLGAITLALPAGAIAGGQDTARVIVRLADEKGVPVTTRSALTLESSLGRWQVEDLDPKEPGVQVFVEGGRGEFMLQSPADPGQARVRVSGSGLEAQGTLDFLPDLRPMVAAGVVEGVLNLRRLDAQSIVPARGRDGFEQELRQFSVSSSDGKADAAARAALFLKGKVKGEYLLTLAYDSDKDTRERLFRDIQPDQFYPVYGDSSERGFDAQSTSKLYVRIDQGRSWLLYGDFTTQSPLDARKLAVYSRSLTGLRQHYENEHVAVNSFASYDSTRQVIDEIPANGTSGPYRLGTAGALENSETVEILVRDRNQPGIVLRSTRQTRFVDYNVEPLTGQLIFRSPIPSLDPAFNPQSIRVTYEVEQGGEKFWVAGVDAQLKLHRNLEVGAIAVEDRNPADPASLRGANASLRLGERTTLVGEFAHSEKASVGSGDASRVELRHEDKDLQASAYTARTDAGFDNPGSYLNRGRAESGAKLAWRVDGATLVRAEALRTEDVSTGGVRDGAYASIERSINELLRVELGLRHGRELGVPAQPSSVGTVPNEFTSARVKLSGQLPALPQAGLFAEYEQDIEDSERKVAAIGGDYQIAGRGRVYFRKELISSLSGPYALNTSQKQNATLFGIEADYMKDGRVFSEYRVRDAFSGAETEAALGLRNMWTVTPGLRLSTSFERVHVIDGADAGEATALALGLEYTASKLWKGSTRLELRDATSSESLFGSVGAAVKLDRDWSLLGRDALAITRNKGALEGERLQHRLQLGVAYRDTGTDVWNGLAMVESRTDRDDTLPLQSIDRRTEIVSLHANWQPIKPLVLSGRSAAKWVEDRSNDFDSRSNAQLLGARLTYEFSERWDAGVVGNLLRGGGALQRGLGVEAGYMVASNLWVSAGYNAFGFSDRDLAGADRTERGAYLRLRFKFDETLLGGSDSRINNSLRPTGS
ncbi:putative repeat protein (TIGR01451 family) [Rivibacter subsaxonicus]|uniref:Putative repeat protein (TIGR01451 family) n=2 Tax=Rivibacter subsaxonicus TaxID=457575 RepID=A0A4V2FUK0_9BURK|nr:putative repeat protein (TIGR01451 family) [Rivibacter subsaxonicus]